MDVTIAVEDGFGGPAVTTAPNSAVTATIYAPDGVVHLGCNGTYTGTFIGSRVRVGKNSQVLAWPPLPGGRCTRPLPVAADVP